MGMHYALQTVIQLKNRTEMNRSLLKFTLVLTTALSAFPVIAGENKTAVPMQAKQTGTYYVQVDLAGTSKSELMLDTGSEYLVINENTLRLLKDEAQVKYVKDVTGVMADGSEIRVPVYHLAHLSIGDRCVIEDVEVAVFRGNSRQILGLSALRKVAPFGVSLEPASLTLSNCQDTPGSREHLVSEIDGHDALNEHHDIASIINSALP